MNQTLNINMSQPGIEDKLSQFKSMISDKLINGYGYELQDDSLSTWIIMITVRNNGSKDLVEKDLQEFIQENSKNFVDWLWKSAKEILNPPIEYLNQGPQQASFNNYPKTQVEESKNSFAKNS